MNITLSHPSPCVKGIIPTPCPECGGRGEIPATPGQPGDGPMPCPRCAVSPADTIRPNEGEQRDTDLEEEIDLLHRNGWGIDDARAEVLARRHDA